MPRQNVWRKKRPRKQHNAGPLLLRPPHLRLSLQSRLRPLPLFLPHRLRLCRRQYHQLRLFDQRHRPHRQVRLLRFHRSHGLLHLQLRHPLLQADRRFRQQDRQLQQHPLRRLPLNRSR